MNSGRGMRPWQWVLAAFAFAFELALWFGAGWMVFRLLRDFSRPLAITAGVVSSGLFILVWAAFFAPRAQRRLKDAPRVLLIAALSLALGLGLAALGVPLPGLILALIGTPVLVAGQFLPH